MICPICGGQQPDNARFCSLCGSAIISANQNVAVQPQYPPQQQVQQNPNYASQGFAGNVQQPYSVPVNQPNYIQPQAYGYAQQPYNQPLPVQNQLPMGWFKFQVNFALFFAAFANVVSGILRITGMFYETQGVSSEEVYLVFKDLVVADVIYGVLMLATAVMCIVSRFRLAAFKKNGPTMLTITLVMSFVSSLLYTMMFAGIVNEVSNGLAADFSSSIGSVVPLIINIRYFKERKHLFVN